MQDDNAGETPGQVPDILTRIMTPRVPVRDAEISAYEAGRFNRRMIVFGVILLLAAILALALQSLLAQYSPPAFGTYR